MPFVKTYAQESYFLSFDRDVMSNGVRNLNLSGDELKDWALLCAVTLRTAQRWFTSGEDRIRIVPELVDFETRLGFVDRTNRQEQYRLLAGLLWNGELVKNERFHGKIKTSRIKSQSYAYAVQTAWKIMTHQPDFDFLGKTFTSISIERTDNKNHPWNVVVVYREPAIGTSPRLSDFPTNPEYANMQTLFFDKEIPNDAIFPDSDEEFEGNGLA